MHWACTTRTAVVDVLVLAAAAPDSCNWGIAKVVVVDTAVIAVAAGRFGWARRRRHPSSSGAAAHGASTARRRRRIPRHSGQPERR